MEEISVIKEDLLTKLNNRIIDVHNWLIKEEKITHAHSCRANICTKNNTLIIECDCQTEFAKKCRNKMYHWKKNDIVLIEKHADNLGCYNICKITKDYMRLIEDPIITEFENNEFEDIIIHTL